MDAWRQDVKVLAAGGYPKIPSERWAPLEPIGRKLGPKEQARIAEESLFIGRVIRRLYERGFLGKQIADLWGFTVQHALRLNRQACEAYALGRIRK